MIKKQLGQYLEGLEQTEITYGLSEASLHMRNVSVKDDALKQLKLPIAIKHGVIQKLDVSFTLLLNRFLGAGPLAHDLVQPSRY